MHAYSARMAGETELCQVAGVCFVGQVDRCHVTEKWIGDEERVAIDARLARQRLARESLQPDLIWAARIIGSDRKEAAERQALALMDHPNVARILDAGSTESGRPYFAMDLVRGVPITEFCDQNRLTPEERLKLFMDVCLAIQHAHQKGIIHRDIKPTNVLVTRDDRGPMVKVIDFGVAKAIGRELTEKTLFTRFEQMIGTPLYMSPEQTEMRSHDVDTRADIYSLGVLLYELLTGTTPFAKERLRNAAYDEICRIIREEEPPKPSTRVSTLGKPLTAVADHRQTDAADLSALIRGDLDWIVMKAIEKNRSRRYDSAGSMHDDIQRYLADEPVEACPPSAFYKIRKFVRRNRGAVLAAVAVVMTLVAGVVGTLTGMFLLFAKNRCLENEQRKFREAESELREVWLNKAIVAAMAGNKAEMGEAAERAILFGESEVWKLMLSGLLADFSGRVDQAIPILERAVSQEPRKLAAQVGLVTDSSLHVWATGRGAYPVETNTRRRRRPALECGVRDQNIHRRLESRGCVGRSGKLEHKAVISALRDWHEMPLRRRRPNPGRGAFSEVRRLEGDRF